MDGLVADGRGWMAKGLVINIFLNKKGLVFTTITRNVYSGKLL